MTFVMHMLAHTPLYVFVLLAYLVWQGALSLRTRERAVWRMLIVPGLFTATGLLLPVLRPGGAAHGGMVRRADSLHPVGTRDRAAPPGG